MCIRQPFAVTAALTVALVSPFAGCSREKTAPVAETQTQTPVRTDNQPVTVSGCLRAGEAAETFVLTSSAPGGTGLLHERLRAVASWSLARTTSSRSADQMA